MNRLHDVEIEPPAAEALPPPPPVDLSREGGGGGSARRRPIPAWLGILAVAGIIAAERLSMLVFVTDAGPGLLLLGGGTFLAVNVGLLLGGAWMIARHAPR